MAAVHSPRVTSDEGLGLVEVLVAMLMLALLAVSFLPVLITGLRLTASNSSVTTASQLVGEQMSQARSKTATCSALTAFHDATPATVTDGGGRTLVTATTLSCPTSYPGTATFTAKVTASGASTVLAASTTLIYVSSN